MQQLVRGAKRLGGTVAPPGDKSISHRALIFNALANGEARVSNLAPGGDCRSTLRCLRALGVRIEPAVEDGVVVVRGAHVHGLREPQDVLHAGNSGTTMRLLSGGLAGQPFLSVLTGDSSLRSRPMGRLIEPLRLMGAHISGRQGGTLPPLVIQGREIQGITYTLPVASAQVKSALLLAGLLARGDTVVIQPAVSRDHTERMLRAMGCSLEEDGLTVRIRPGQPAALDVEVPGDLSAAAFWLVAGAAHPQAKIRITDTGVNPTRCGVLEVLEAMGARVVVENHRLQGGEPVADLVVESSQLQGVEVRGPLIARVVDELPVLAVAACFARGTTVIRDAGELRVKESDRIATTVRELARLGAQVEELPDGMIIRGTGQLTGSRCRSHGDHRLAMALGVAAILARGETVIQGAQAASVSYPAFWEHLRQLSLG
ncbi:MAG: 3-phosphoshikimate 1-carboxyvinyltransferase [Dehalococcoidia bacterium]